MAGSTRRSQLLPDISTWKVILIVGLFLAIGQGMPSIRWRLPNMEKRHRPYAPVHQLFDIDVVLTAFNSRNDTRSPTRLVAVFTMYRYLSLLVL